MYLLALTKSFHGRGAVGRRRNAERNENSGSKEDKIEAVRDSELREAKWYLFANWELKG
jgi:hypothetical protein